MFARLTPSHSSCFKFLVPQASPDQYRVEIINPVVMQINTLQSFLPIPG